MVVNRLALFGVFWDKMRIDIKWHLGIVGIETPQLQLATAKPRFLHNFTLRGGQNSFIGWLHMPTRLQ